MWETIRKLFKRDKHDRYKSKTLFDFLMHYRDSEKELSNMCSYIYENWYEKHMCEPMKYPSKKIIRRYNLNRYSQNQFTWYLLEQYFKGNITINEDVQSK